MRRFTRRVVLGFAAFSLAAAFGQGTALANNYRVIDQRGLWDSTSYVIQCDNGKQRTITLDKKTALYWYAYVGMGRGWKTMDDAAKEICEKT